MVCPTYLLSFPDAENSNKKHAASDIPATRAVFHNKIR